MAFIVEDGTGVANANTYMTDVEFKAYHADRGVSITASGGDIQKALVRAADYITQRFGGRFKGSEEFAAQTMPFPRTELHDRRGDEVIGIPDKLKWAQAEYGQVALSADLWLEPTVDATGSRISRVKEKVGPIESDITYSEGTGVSTIKKLPRADGWIEEYLKTRGTVVRA